MKTNQYCTHANLNSFLDKKILKGMIFESNEHELDWQLVIVFSEKIDVTKEFSVFLLLWPWKLGQSHQNLIRSFLCPNYLSIKICKNQITGSQDIVQTWKCHAYVNGIIYNKRIGETEGCSLKMRSSGRVMLVKE